MIKNGTEPFLSTHIPLDITITDFWKWAYSDLLSNAHRGVLAEYLVAHAIAADQKTRVEWDAYDVISPTGIRVEVKSAAYIQSWQQTSPSPIRFSIAPARGWHAESNTYNIETSRSAHIYVFCLLHHQDKETINPMDTSQWTFYVLPTRILNERCPLQKSIALSQTLLLGAVEANYDQLSVAIQKIADQENLPPRQDHLIPD